MVSSELLVKILGRRDSLFKNDLAAHHAEIREFVKNSRILVTGAAGSIGSAFIEQLANFHPAAIHLIDPSENNLVEVVRSIRSSDVKAPNDFRTWAIGIGSMEFDRFLEMSKPYDAVVNFAALKHVRSERDPFTLMRLIRTNIFALQEMLERLTPTPPKRIFSVSSDKAVNPENAMGASKAYMEQVLWHYATTFHCTSARFANVAFSDGSLLHGFLRRMEKNQPLSAPEDVRRYFISHQEAGQLCLIACFLGNNREMFIPRLDPTEDLQTFAEIAKFFLQSKGYQPRIFREEEEARLFARSMTSRTKEWPCYFSRSDTSGEKLFEEFIKDNEQVNYERFERMGVINNPPFGHSKLLQKSLTVLREMRHANQWRRRDMVAALKIMVPTLHHIQREKNLDQKM